MRILLLFAGLLLSMALEARFTVTGRVVDARSKEPLAFVPVLVVGEREGTTTDIDGKFTLQVDRLPVTLRFSYVGYIPLELVVESSEPVIVTLVEAVAELKALEVLPTENPAHRIIKRTIANHKDNDGMRERAHRYTSYSKTVFTVEVDSLLRTDSTRIAEMDSSDREGLAFVDSQHLFLMESATRKSFIPPAAEREEVLAMSVSGLKDPSFLALAAQTKTFSIYEPQIMISEKTYLGPLAPSSTNKYLFLLEDTLYQGGDSVFVISYKPRSRTKFNGLKGLLYIHTGGYAVQNVTAEAAEREEGFSIRFQQLHEKVQDKAWFPTQLNAFIYLDNVDMGIGKPYGVSRTYLKDIEVDAAVLRKEVRGPELVMDRMSTRQPDEYWNALRTDSLDSKDLKTYHVIDSLGAEIDLDRKVKWFTALTTGRLPIGPVDLLLDKLLRYNAYEGLRLGVGLATNDRLTRYGSLGGYFGYGFNDEAWKYGGFLTLKPWYGRDIAVKLYHENDVVESGGVTFEGPKRWISTESTRWLYVNRMDRSERTGAQFAFRAGGSLKLWVGTERELRINDIGYEYAEPELEGVTVLKNSFLTGGVTLGARFAFRERIARLPDREVALGTKWPVLSVSAFRSFPGLWEGELETWRVNASIDKIFHIRLVGDLSLRLMGGMADPDAPYSYLYNLRGTNGGGTKEDPTLLLAADNTFQTMVANEFLADRYAALHLKHSFGTLLVKGKHFKPRPGIVYNVGVGALDSPERHRGYTFTALSEPFLEGGVVVDGLLSTIGVGVYYRHGAHALPTEGDNFVFKITSSFAF